MDRVPVVIDTDPGIDDALALLLAARWPECDLLAVTTTYGNTTLDYATRNARLVLTRAPSLVPVIAGADRPIERDLITAKETHGAEGLGDHEVGIPDAVSPAANALLEALRSAGRPVVLITLGPLTNLALALRTDRDLVRKHCIRHVAMAGNIAAAGNTGPHSEFNAWCDPEALREVVRAELGTELVGLDVTRQLVIPAAAVELLATHDDKRARWLGRLLGFYVRFHETAEGLSGAVINDPLAIALAVRPGLGEKRPHRVEIDLSAGEERGRTRPGAGDPITAWHAFDKPAVHRLLVEHVFGPWLSPGDFKA